MSSPATKSFFYISCASCIRPQPRNQNLPHFGSRLPSPPSTSPPYWTTTPQIGPLSSPGSRPPFNLIALTTLFLVKCFLQDPHCLLPEILFRPSRLMTNNTSLRKFSSSSNQRWPFAVTAKALLELYIIPICLTHLCICFIFCF